MKVDVKLVFLLVLGIIILTLINEIVYTKEYNKEGFVSKLVSDTKKGVKKLGGKAKKISGKAKKTLKKLNPLELVKEQIDNLKDEIMKPINKIGETVQIPIDKLKDEIMKPINAIGDTIQKPINALKSAVMTPIQKSINLVNYIIRGVNEVITFICFCKETFKWVGHTVKCTFALFWPLYCPLIRIIDMLIELVGFIIGSIFRLFGLGFLVRVFNRGVGGIDSISELFFDIKLTSIWEKLFKNCYRCEFKPFPVAKKR